MLQEFHQKGGDINARDGHATPQTDLRILAPGRKCSEHCPRALPYMAEISALGLPPYPFTPFSLGATPTLAGHPTPLSFCFLPPACPAPPVPHAPRACGGGVAQVPWVYAADIRGDARPPPRSRPSWSCALTSTRNRTTGFGASDMRENATPLRGYPQSTPRVPIGRVPRMSRHAPADRACVKCV